MPVFTQTTNLGKEADMDAFLWSLVGIGVSWIPVGYLLSRLVNATGQGHSFVCPYYGSECRCPASEVNWNWRRPVITEYGRVWFTIGIVTGWVGLTVAFLYSLLLLALFYLITGLGFVGKGVVPKNSH